MLIAGKWGDSWICPVCSGSNSGARLKCNRCEYKTLDTSPVAWRVRGYNQLKTGDPSPWRYVDGVDKPSVNKPDCCDFEPLYAAPVRTKDLTDDEIYTLYSEPCSDREMLEFARAVIAADRGKNK